MQDTHNKIYNSTDWTETAKRLLKAELLKKGINNRQLTVLLSNIGVQETKSSIDSKICRGTFSAVFFLQCLYAIGSKQLIMDISMEDMNR